MSLRSAAATSTTAIQYFSLVLDQNPDIPCDQGSATTEENAAKSVALGVVGQLLPDHSKHDNYSLDPLFLDESAEF